MIRMVKIFDDQNDFLQYFGDYKTNGTGMKFCTLCFDQTLSDSRRMRIKRGSDKDQGDGGIHEIGTKGSHT